MAKKVWQSEAHVVWRLNLENKGTKFTGVGPIRILQMFEPTADGSNATDANPWAVLSIYPDGSMSLEDGEILCGCPPSKGHGDAGTIEKVIKMLDDAY